MADTNANVIVAIPAEDDYVWQISSEKVPHMTILYLGDIAENESQILEFLAHTTEMFYRFGLSVDHRGKLGPDEADVLFFASEYGIKPVEQFRTNLLLNPVIKQAYDSVQQFPQWTPHLTLGYPTSPAKPDKRDYPGINYIRFDRIALWTSDYNGPEFELSNDPRWEMSMSDLASQVLEHHGVKGMKWGVRKDRGHEGEQASTKTIAKADKKYEKTHKQGLNAWINTQNTFAKHANPLLDELNNNPKYKDKNLYANRSLYESYYKDYEKTVDKAAAATTKEFGTNASGTRQMKVTRNGFGENATWQAELVDVKHAEGDAFHIRITPKLDATGHIIDQTIEDLTGNSATHSDITAESILAHHGVKGMKWGVRKDGSTSSTSVRTSRLSRPASDVIAKQKPGQFVRTTGGKKQIASEDAVRVAAARQIAKKSTTDALTNKQLQDAVTRMNLEMQYSQLAKKSDRRTRGQRFIHTLFGGNASKHNDGSAASQAAKQVAATLAKKAAAGS